MSPTDPTPTLAVHGTPSSPKGRSLHTTTSVPPSTRLATYANPLLALPTASTSSQTCHHCLRTASVVHPCSACRAVSYCSKTCQRASWKLVHKPECAALKNVPAGRELPTPVRALLQVVVRREVWGAVMGGLVGHEGEFRRDRGGRVWGDLKLQGEMVKMLLREEREWVGGGDVVGKYAVAMCKLLTNMFNVHDPDLGYDAVFLDGGLAMVNHSCVPNASAHIFGRTALLVSDRPIGADEEVTISYTDPSYPLSQRKQDLAKYHFECKCPRCEDDLNIYQATRLLHPSTIKANAFSLIQDPALLTNPPPSSSSSGPLPKGTSLQTTIHNAIEALPQSPSHQPKDLPRLRVEYEICSPFIKSSLWAMLPPSFLTDSLTYYLSREAHTESLLLTCLAACRIHPYTHPNPANPYRLKGALALCRALSNATADRSVYASSLRAVYARTEKRAAARHARDVDVDLLVDLDAVATGRMVFDMLEHYVSVTQLEDWPLATQVREGREAVRGIPWGLDAESRKVMEQWERREGGDEAWLGIWRRMVDLLDGLAELGARMVVADFGE